MKNPFVYGHLDEEVSFVNRTEDIDRLRQNINNQIHTILLSPRRWGKSSLVKVLKSKSGFNKKTVFCYIDMFNISKEDDFFNQFANAILNVTSSKFEEFITNVKDYLSSLKANFSYDNGDLGEFSLNFSMGEDDNSFLEILNLPEKIAKRKKIKLVVCIDEFQNLMRFEDPLLFQQRLRANWQHHQNVVYLLYGSKRSMLSSLFESQSMPFYRFGDVFYLQKIAASHWIKFIQSSFRKTGKKITRKYAVRITEVMETHTYYVQQFSHILWNNTDSEVTDEIFDKTVKEIISRNSFMFENIYENLSYYQMKALQMIAKEPNAKFTGKEAIKKYEFGSSSNVIQALKALENKEIIDRFEGYTQFVDPVFRLWMFVRIFKTKF